jgi:hypothetical protein
MEHGFGGARPINLRIDFPVVCSLVYRRTLSRVENGSIARERQSSKIDLIAFSYFFELANFEKLEPRLKDLKLARSLVLG